MIRSLLRFAVLPLAAVLLAAAPLAAQQYPDEPGTGVADLAGVLRPADADSIRAMLHRMRDRAGVEVRVLTVRSVDEFRTGAATPEAFATGVYNAWKLGYGQRQDGVLVMLSVEDRFTRIELGDGVPADKDARMRAVVDGTMVPRFRDGDMSGGLRDGVLEIARAFYAAALTAEAPYDPSADLVPPPATQPQPAFQPLAERGTGGPAVAPMVVFLAIAGAGAGLLLLVVRRKPVCATCKVKMEPLDEAADDVFLDSGRRLEEVLGSVDYTVWKCGGCGGHEIRRSARMFSGKDTCPQCGYRTVNVEKTVIDHPTYTSSGTQRVEKDCAHCHWHDVDLVHLPQKTRPAPSSSRSSFSGSGSGSRSSGGGSSGGSSSGRGSSGRW